MRKDLGDLATLKKSILTYGQISPIVIDHSMNLIAGGRRLAACTELDREVLYLFREEADSTTAKVLELEENLVRKSFTDEETVLAVLQIHELMCAKHGAATQGASGGWTLSDTASMLGFSFGTVQLYITVAKNLDSYPEVRDILKSGGIVEAYKTIRYLQEREATNQLHEIMSQQVENALSGDALRQEGSKEDLVVQCAKLVDQMWVHGDCTQHVKTLPNGLFGMIHTDPPYGIEINKSKKDSFKGDLYGNDTPEEFRSVWSILAPELFRVSKTDAYAFVWTSWEMLPYLAGVMTQAGWALLQLPFIWVRTGVGYQCMNPSEQLASGVDWALVFRKGSPKLAKEGTPNFSLAPALSSAQKTHGLERPVGLVAPILSTFALPATMVYDPFGGGGSTLKSCIAASMVGVSCEKDENHYKRTRVELVRMLAGMGEEKEDEPSQETV